MYLFGELTLSVALPIAYCSLPILPISLRYCAGITVDIVRMLFGFSLSTPEHSQGRSEQHPNNIRTTCAANPALDRINPGAARKQTLYYNVRENFSKP